MLLFTIFDENLSWYVDDNIQIHRIMTTDTDDEDFVESNKMRSKKNKAFETLFCIFFCYFLFLSLTLMAIAYLRNRNHERHKVN